MSVEAIRVYCDSCGRNWCASLEDRKDRSNGGAKCGSIGLGRGLTLGKLSVKKKGGVK